MDALKMRVRDVTNERDRLVEELASLQKKSR